MLAVYGGFVEVLPDRVRVLADAAEFCERNRRGEGAAAPGRSQQTVGKSSRSTCWR